ncbi:hypothetical protein PENSPDRAFT_645691 [Peniophora sp. CONT]|nr:hypothetical protein PENSPDRAFT_645691 [Peniophora sp. CONT]
MFIAIVGTRSSGKNTVLDYLVTRGLIHLRLGMPNHTKADPDPLCFDSASVMLDFATENWQKSYVTTDLKDLESIRSFSIRPFFLLLSIDAPLRLRFERGPRRSLDAFINEHDELMHGSVLDKKTTTCPLYSLREYVTLQIVNNFATKEDLHSHLDAINMLNTDRLRPSWDTYFMTLSELASMRSNCMKRRVGAILVRDKRIVATGYNGTPRGLVNCNEGGCTRCNHGAHEDACLCLHAEENALLEAGRERIDGATLYCNTCPCLKCTIKIIQVGVKEVVYNLSYKVDDASAKLFGEANVLLRRHASPQ